MPTDAFLQNQLLIAMPALGDPNFNQTVTYICEHNADGAFGVIVNRPMDVTLADVFDQLDIDVRAAEAASPRIYAGGPVQPQRGFVIHSPVGNWNATLEIGGDVGVTSSRDILEAMAQGSGPSQTLFAVGCAGWGAGQLEQEFADNAWLTAAANPELLFETPAEERWHAAARLIGVDISRLSGDAGHA
jgi:putative transcriptional regulator